MRVLVFMLCAALLLALPDLARAVSKEGPVICGKKWATFPVIGYNSPVRNKDGVVTEHTWQDTPMTLTKRKTDIETLRIVHHTWAVMLKDSRIVYGLSEPTYMSLILCLD